METKSKTDPALVDECDSNPNEDIASMELNTGLDQEEFSSHELHEIISHKPNWIVRKGMIFIGFVILCLLGLASFVQYPDHITVNMKVVSTHAPEKVISPCEGRLQKLIVNGRRVRKNEMLAFVQSDEKYPEVQGINKKGIFSPEDGTIRYNVPLQHNQYVYAGQNLFYIEPENNSFYGESIVHQAEFGKIKEGQTVIIKLERYPYSEYGYLLGKISFISPVPDNDNNYRVYITLPDDMRSSYNKTLSYENNLTSQAEIITGNHKLLEKIVAFGNPLARK